MSYLFRLQARARTTSILVRAFWNFKLPEEVFLQYSRNCISQYILVAKAWHPLTYIHNLMVNATQYFWKCKNFEIFPMMKVLEKKSNFGKLLGPKVFRIIKSSKYFRKCKNFEIFPMMLNIWMVFKKKSNFVKLLDPKVCIRPPAMAVAQIENFCSFSDWLKNLTFAKIRKLRFFNQSENWYFVTNPKNEILKSKTLTP